MLEKTEICGDGVLAVELSSSTIRKSLESLHNPSTSFFKIQPITLMLVDFQLPRKNGLEVISMVKSFVSNLNCGEAKEKRVTIVEPDFVIMSAYLNQSLISHLMSKGIDKLINKPTQIESLS